MADPKKPTPKPDIYGIDRSKTTTDVSQLFKGFIDFNGKPTGGYNLPSGTAQSFAFGGQPAKMGPLGNIYGLNPSAPTAPAKPAVQAGKPATGGSVMDNYRLNQVAANAAQQRLSNIPKPPAGIPTTRPAAPKRFTADDLYIDPTPAFQPVLDQYAAQQAQLQDRYGENAADIKNIFGNLSTVRALDKTKIAQQYQTSIQQQQDALAARTAEARMATEAGQQGAATAAGEMGTAGQPAPTTSLTAQAAEQGIADSNAYQTTWAALQNVMSQQAQNDVQNAIQGYDYQQTAALETLRNNLEDRLAAIQGNVAGTQSQLAQAQLEGQQTVANAKYGEELQRRAAAQSLAAAQAAAANKKPSYSSDSFGLQQRAADAGIDYAEIQSTVNDAYNSAYAMLNPAGSVKKVTPKKSDILNAWNAIKGGSPQTAARLSPYVTAYVDQMF